MDCTRVFVSGPTVLLLPVPGQRRCCRPPTQSHGDRFSLPRRFIVSALRGGGLPFHGMARRPLAPGTGERVRRPTARHSLVVSACWEKGEKEFHTGRARRARGGERRCGHRRQGWLCMERIAAMHGCTVAGHAALSPLDKGPLSGASRGDQKGAPGFSLSPHFTANPTPALCVSLKRFSQSPRAHQPFFPPLFPHPLSAMAVWHDALFSDVVAGRVGRDPIAATAAPVVVAAVGTKSSAKAAKRTGAKKAPKRAPRRARRRPRRQPRPTRRIRRPRRPPNSPPRRLRLHRQRHRPWTRRQETWRTTTSPRPAPPLSGHRPRQSPWPAKPAATRTTLSPGLSTGPWSPPLWLP